MTLAVSLWGPQYEVSRDVTRRAMFSVSTSVAGQGSMEVSAHAKEKGVFTASVHNVIKLDMPKVSRHRVQLVSGRTGRVIADSQGTQKQKDKYKELVSGNGLSANAGAYALKITDAAGNDHSRFFAQCLHVGSSYSSSYNWTSRCQGSGLAVLANNPEFQADDSPYSTASITAAYLFSQHQTEKRPGHALWV